MSIAEKLTTIAENEQKVYDAGYEKGKAEGGTGGTDYLSYAARAEFDDLNRFGKSEVVINMPYLMSADVMFRQAQKNGSNTTVEHITINGGEEILQAMNMMFYFGAFWPADAALKHITFNFGTSKVTSCDNMFGYCANLEIVDGTPLDFSSVTNSTVRIGASAVKLAYIRFAPQTIKCNLNAADSSSYTSESIQSIIDGLADLTDGTAKTLTLHSTVGAKLTDEQKATITAKNWTLVY